MLRFAAFSLVLFAGCGGYHPTVVHERRDNDRDAIYRRFGSQYVQAACASGQAVGTQPHTIDGLTVDQPCGSVTADMDPEQCQDQCDAMFSARVAERYPRADVAAAEQHCAGYPWIATRFLHARRTTGTATMRQLLLRGMPPWPSLSGLGVRNGRGSCGSWWASEEVKTMRDIPLDKLQFSDFQDMQHDAVRESRHLDYKWQLATNWNDTDKKEFLADVSSFANTGGGDIVWGIEEGKDTAGNNTGIISTLHGVPSTVLDLALQKLEGFLRTGMEPRIPGTRFHEVPGGPEGPLLVLRIPPEAGSRHT